MSKMNQDEEPPFKEPVGKDGVTSKFPNFNQPDGPRVTAGGINWHPTPLDQIPATTKLIVVCIEGVHGVGKTTICRLLRSYGFNVRREIFVEKVADSPLPPGSFTQEISWITSWCDWITSFYRDHVANEDSSGGVKILFSDRCPLTPPIYATSHNALLEMVARTAFSDLEEFLPISIVPVFIQLDLFLVYPRIVKRAQAEPIREKFNELLPEHLERVDARYKSSYRDLFSFALFANNAFPDGQPEAEHGSIVASDIISILNSVKTIDIDWEGHVLPKPRSRFSEDPSSTASAKTEEP